MKKSLFRIVGVALVLSLATFAFAADAGSWTGWITDTACAAKGATASHADCAVKCVKEKGAKWALYTEADKSVWVLSDQDGAAKMAGKMVTVKGTADKDKKMITVTSMEPAAAHKM
ncbi:MAG TPA: hypothetical protein VEG84_08115 [Thermoanaerobaculia bacterium]|nr:hypothetical protein [Thermoanaerobaculia bacterium]